MESADEKLIRAIRDHSVEAMGAALAKGADPNARSENGDPALSVAVERFDTGEGVRVLLGAGADPNATGEDGWGPLHVAISQGKVGAAKSLLKAGADDLAMATQIELLRALAERAAPASPEAEIPIVQGNVGERLRERRLPEDAKPEPASPREPRG